MSYRDWHVGGKVVCVDGTWGASGAIQRHYCPALPSEGEVYTIRTIECRVVVRGQSPEVLIRLDEVRNPAPTGVEPLFFASKFRPVQPRATDISIFTALLTGAKEREPA